MSAKRPAIDLLALTSEQAVPMPEAAQRMAPPAPVVVKPAPTPSKTAKPPAVPPEEGRVPSANLEALAFKVPPEFRRRFRQAAAGADLKLNELLFAAFAAWEAQQGGSRRKA